MGKNDRQRFLHNPDGSVRANLNWRQRLPIMLLAALVSTYIRLVIWTCRIKVVHGQQHREDAIARGVFIPCGWHQRLFISGIFLLTLKRHGVQPGFLISPSREGEFIARVARAHNTAVMRGSSTRTGREAMAAMRRGIADGISPMIFGDGPKGPPGQFKVGAVVLSNRSGTPVLPIGCALDRYWTLKTWDQTRIPKPFARMTIALGPLQSCASDSNAAWADDAAATLAREIDALTAIAEQAIEPTVIS